MVFKWSPVGAGFCGGFLVENSTSRFSLQLPLQLSPKMNPFVLLAMAITSLLGALHSTFTISSTLSPLLEPSPPPSSLAIPVSTIGFTNLSVILPQPFCPSLPSSFFPSPSFPWTGASTSDDQSTTVSPEDLHIITTKTTADQDNGDLPDRDLQDYAQVSCFLVTLSNLDAAHH